MTINSQINVIKSIYTSLISNLLILYLDTASVYLSYLTYKP